MGVANFYDGVSFVGLLYTGFINYDLTVSCVFDKTSSC